ncbi:hypothetical protein IAR55_005696 [Kwoniella newhampshirensis]|uniref:Uncharacterized protein n=1 Tax=Kwoniella newhampshirensis TaxID=1651941 RepID=A0AAW0YUL1_9TREE
MATSNSEPKKIANSQSTADTGSDTTSAWNDPAVRAAWDRASGTTSGEGGQSTATRLAPTYADVARSSTQSSSRPPAQPSRLSARAATFQPSDAEDRNPVGFGIEDDKAFIPDL